MDRCVIDAIRANWSSASGFRERDELCVDGFDDQESSSNGTPK